MGECCGKSNCGCGKCTLLKKMLPPANGNNVPIPAVPDSTGGGGGYAINIMGEASTLEVEGEEHVSVYRAMKGDKESEGRRHFCSKCGSPLYLYDPRWADWVYPMASAIDTPLPAAPERVHLMLGSKATWVPVPPSDTVPSIETLAN